MLPAAREARERQYGAVARRSVPESPLRAIQAARRFTWRSGSVVVLALLALILLLGPLGFLLYLLARPLRTPSAVSPGQLQ